MAEDGARRAAKAAAAGKAYEALTEGGAAEIGDAATAAHIGPGGGIKGGGIKDGITHGVKEAAANAPPHPWHTAPWHALTGAVGTKGALAVGGALAALGLVIGGVVVLSDRASSDDSALETDRDPSGGDKRRDPGGGDKTRETAGSSSTESTTGSSTTTVPGTPSTTGGQTTTPGGAATPPPSTPSGGPGATTPVTAPPATQPPATAPTVTTTSTTRPVPPSITRFVATLNPNSPCRVETMVNVTFTWASNGVTATLTPKGGNPITGFKGNGSYTTCSYRAHSWTLTVTASNGTSASKTISST